MSDALYSGWGVRTMAEGQGGYNPVEYHNGTVWPHDNSIIAAGLRRYGYHAEAARIADSLVRAAAFFGYRLPEVFAGCPAQMTHVPVAYPTASSPQAWAAGPLASPLVIIAQRVRHAGERADLDTILAHCRQDLVVRPAPSG